eukprot:5890325-Pleurochrysis_carterae.AAC.2
MNLTTSANLTTIYVTVDCHFSVLTSFTPNRDHRCNELGPCEKPNLYKSYAHRNTQDKFNMAFGIMLNASRYTEIPVTTRNTRHATCRPELGRSNSK